MNQSATDDDLAYIRQRIPMYAAYDDEDSAHMTDKQIRAWVGEALGLVRERLALPSGPTADRLEDVIFECEFADQKLFVHLDHGAVTRATLAALEAADRTLIDLAAQAPAVTAETLPELLDAIETQFKTRVATANAS